MSDRSAHRSEPPPDLEERRAGERHLACFPAHIQRQGGSTRMALIRDLSVSGALLLTRAQLQVGEAIRLSLYLSEDANEARPASGRVVRFEPRDPEHAEVWHNSAAIQFDEPLRDCEAEIKALAEKQAALGVPLD